MWAVIMKKMRGKYSEKFKSNALKLVLKEGISIREAAKQLSMPKATLSGWVKKEGGSQSISKESAKQESHNEISEINTLRKMLKKVRNERDELRNKVASAFAASGHSASIEDTLKMATAADSSNDTLLERALIQWQYGDWEGLVSLNGNQLRIHPDRAKLTLLVATAWQQLNDDFKVRKYLELARGFGCDKKNIARLLVAGVHNTLGRAAAASRQESKALSHFRNAVIGLDGNAPLACHARSVREITRLGLLQQAAVNVSNELNTILNNLPSLHQTEEGNPQIKILQTELELIQGELALAHKRQQLFPRESLMSVSEAGSNEEEWHNAIKKQSVSQLGQDIWVLERTGYKKGGFFVEFGATNGILLSNTYLLEKEFGWQGICAEPNPIFFDQLKHNRTCQVSNACIGGKTGEKVLFVYADAYGGMLKYALEDDHADKREAYAKLPGKQVELETISLHDFLVSSKAPKFIDYLSIDTEGSEFEILSDFPFDKWRIQLITVEHNFTQIRNQIRTLLEQHGYSCTEQKWDDWYELEV